MKIVIVLNEDLGVGFLANAAACIASGLFHKEENIMGEYVKGHDVDFIPITKIPILILKQNKKSWEELLKRTKKNKLKYMIFTKEAQSTTNYEEYIQKVNDKKLEEIEVIGLGVLGEDEPIGKFSGDLPLLK